MTSGRGIDIGSLHGRGFEMDAESEDRTGRPARGPRQRLQRHEDTFLTLAETATEKRFDMEYRKTYPFKGKWIDDWHKHLAEAPQNAGMIDIGIEGWLLAADALKLYELARFSHGDTLELGTYRGLSTSILAQATETSGSNGVIISFDLDPAATATAKTNLAGRPGAERVHLFTVEAGQAVRDLARAKRTFNFAFIDHSHEFDHVFDVCQSLHRVLNFGAFALFHDFNDPRNASEQAPDYGVYQATLDGLRADRFEFWGIYGCCGLFRRIGPV
jgi:predicted O-methyltransferase YrrM